MVGAVAASPAALILGLIFSGGGASLGFAKIIAPRDAAHPDIEALELDAINGSDDLNLHHQAAQDKQASEPNRNKPTFVDFPSKTPNPTSSGATVFKRRRSASV